MVVVNVLLVGGDLLLPAALGPLQVEVGDEDLVAVDGRHHPTSSSVAASVLQGREKLGNVVGGGGARFLWRMVDRGGATNFELGGHDDALAGFLMKLNLKHQFILLFYKKFCISNTSLENCLYHRCCLLSRNGFAGLRLFFDVRKKNSREKTQALKKLKQIFQKTQDIFSKTLKSANSFLM